MKEVLCVRGSKFLVKGEWYKVILSSDQSFQLENHTDITWDTSQYHKVNFATVQELREYKLNQILK
jgi:hypothetical protein